MTSGRWCFWLLYLSLISLALCQELLYHTSPSQKKPKSDTQGIWGGRFDIWANGTATNLSSTGIYCANMQRAGFYRGISTREISYDLISGKAFVNMQVMSSSRTAAFTMPVCDAHAPKCENSNVNVYFAQSSRADEDATGNLGPFALWNNTVYFIANRYQKAKSRLLNHTIDLRKLQGCEQNYPFSIIRPIDIEACSVHVATFAEETKHDLGLLFLEDGLSTARHLYVHYDKATMQTTFLTQIQNNTVNDDYDSETFALSLVAVTEGGKPTVLHVTSLPVDYTNERDDISHLGSISYRDDTLCWSVWDRILCAAWTGEGALGRVVTVLPQGMAANRGICSVSGNDGRSSIDKSNLITGVAIGDADRTINLVFGCYAGRIGQGGAGLLRINKDGSDRQLLPLRDDSGKVFAGGVFFACQSNHGRSSAPGSFSETIQLNPLLLVLSIWLYL